LETDLFHLQTSDPLQVGDRLWIQELNIQKEAQRERKKVEALFAELKNQIGLRRLRLRRLKFVREQFFLAAVTQNIKRLVRFLSQPTTPTMEVAT